MTARALNADLLAELQSADPKPVTLLAIETKDGTTPWIRLCSLDLEIVFPETTGDTYTPRPFSVSEVTISPTEKPSLALTFADVDAYFDTWLLTTNFKDHRVWRYLIERDEYDSAVKAVRECYRLDPPTQQHNAVRFVAKPLLFKLSEVGLPRRVMTREGFPGMAADGRSV